MYNTSNPAELYTGTTWELLPTDRYLKTTTGTPLSTGGSNSFTISKANLPNITLRVNSFSVTTQKHEHTYPIGGGSGGNPYGNADGWVGGNSFTSRVYAGGGQNTGTASPSTETLGSGTSINVTPTYITIRAWKRLS